MSLTTTHERSTPPADFGDVRAEFHALISGCGVYDLGSRAKIRLTGQDRVRWLNGVVTNNIRDLATGRGVYAFLLNPQGHIQGDIYVYNQGESLLVDTEQVQATKIREFFDHYIIMDDVEVTDISGELTTIGVAGPKAKATLEASGFLVPELESLQFAKQAWNGIDLTLNRGDNPATLAYEIWLAPAHFVAVWDALLKTGAIPAGASAVEMFRIASGIPRYGQDIRERDLPQETEQARALHFSKGCYIGQEIVERIRSRGNVHRKFTGFMIEGAWPEPGTKIQVDGKDIGEITSVASLPLGDAEQPVGLGYIRREVGISGKVVAAGASKATVVNLPFPNIFQQ